MKIFLIALTAVIGLGAIGGLIRGSSTSGPQQQLSDAESSNIARAFLMASSLKKAMREPESFKLSTVRIIDNTNAVCYKYRAHNGFGGTDIGEAVLTPKGNFLTNESDGFTATWNKECANKQGLDEVETVSYMLNH